MNNQQPKIDPDKVKAIARARDLPMYRLAHALALGPSNLTAVLKGVRPAPAAFAEKLASALCVPLAAILFSDGDDDGAGDEERPSYMPSVTRPYRRPRRSVCVVVPGDGDNGDRIACGLEAFPDELEEIAADGIKRRRENVKASRTRTGVVEALHGAEIDNDSEEEDEGEDEGEDE